MEKETKKSKAFRYGFALTEGGLIGGSVLAGLSGHPELASELGTTALGVGMGTGGTLFILAGRKSVKKKLKKVV